MVDSVTWGSVQAKVLAHPSAVFGKSECLGRQGLECGANVNPLLALLLEISAEVQSPFPNPDLPNSHRRCQSQLPSRRRTATRSREALQHARLLRSQSIQVLRLTQKLKSAKCSDGAANAAQTEMTKMRRTDLRKFPDTKSQLCLHAQFDVENQSEASKLTASRELHRPRGVALVSDLFSYYRSGSRDSWATLLVKGLEVFVEQLC